MSGEKTTISSTIDRIILSAFPRVTTHLKHTNDQSLSTALFPHDCFIAALAVSFNRYTIKYPDETKVSRIFWSVLLGYLAWENYDYWILICIHLLSFGQYVFQTLKAKMSKDQKMNIIKHMKLSTTLLSVYILSLWVVYSIARPQSIYSITQTKLYDIIISTTFILQKGNAFHPLYDTIKTNAMDTLGSLLPITEIKDAYDLLTEFVQPHILNAKIYYVLFITFHIQSGMGFLGIEFLRKEQHRKNALIKIEDQVKEQKSKDQQDAKYNGKDKKEMNGNKNDKEEEEKDVSKKFRQSAGPFILFVALPYMAQIVFYGAVNMYAYHCFRDDIHRTIRLNDLFENGGSRFVATANASALSPGGYATNSETVINTVYDLFNQNFFSLPKLMLLPQVIAKQPMLLIKITPLILFSDYIKSTIVSTITTETERMKKEVKEKESLRNRIEQYDLKNSELIQRSGYDSVPFTQARWIELTEDIQELEATASIMRRSKMYFSWVQRHFVMMALVDCALANLIAVGKIVASDIFVYARAIEDFIGFILMRSRAESELASMASSIKVLRELKNVWDDSTDRNLLKCNVGSGLSDAIEIKDLSYSRGSAYVSIKDIKLSSGVYAVTGANGSGKSTLFRLLMACDTNRKSIDMDSSILIKAPGIVNMSSSNVVEISQNFYWPLNTAPVDWIYHTNMNQLSSEERERRVSKLVNELRSLKLYPETQPGSDLTNDLVSVKDDWFADLSGGQKSKVELVRKVFLEERCPNVLLIDETFAPLDPDSKSLIMQKLKEFCSNSIVLVIYHADVKVTEGNEEIEDDACVPSSNFFDANLHVEDGALLLRSVCSS
jgi:ABC-type multidrug transport system fused ATPase/permease subunit